MSDPSNLRAAAGEELASRRPENAPQNLSTLSSMLENLEEAPATEPARSKSAIAHENKLVQVRLGMASCLFMSLRSKHAPTAAHSLRVALGCSSWSLTMKMTEEERDEIEVAALLHDLGKMGVPDHILRKPGRLSEDEVAAIDRHRQSGMEILAACSASRNILDVVQYASAWYDGVKNCRDLRREKLPLGSRMIAIVDAFDSMTTDHVYRRALSRERAMAELFSCAGTQFDPKLVKNYCELLASDRVKFNANVARRWLQELHPQASDALWCRSNLLSNDRETSIDDLFQQKLVDSMQDGVAFIDNSLKILLWNRAAERLTGLQAGAVLQKQWTTDLLEMRDGNDLDIARDCPIRHCVKSGVQTMRRMTIAGRGDARVAVDAQVVPVIGRNGVTYGATLLMHDASSQITLEERVESLHVKATRDPLTGVSNRAEFDRVHELFVATHLDQNLPCSLIICDLDFFKRINDTYGHQAGDDALVSFAALLQRFGRQGDLVARYGGEEFVILCADCDNMTATDRAEQIRKEIAEMPQPTLGGRSITASFGVTEVQAGDTPETMLRRADRALLQAKDLGRNTVVQLGAGIGGEPTERQKRGWLSWFKSAAPEELLKRTLITAVPLNVVVEKLRGFVADHYAEITSIDEEHIVLKVDGRQSGSRRSNDRPVPFLFELKFEEANIDVEGRGEVQALRTLIDVSIRPIRNRDRRKRNIVDGARLLLTSLKSYLMAQDHGGSNAVKGAECPEDEGVLDKAKQVLAPLFSKPDDGR